MNLLSSNIEKTLVAIEQHRDTYESFFYERHDTDGTYAVGLQDVHLCRKAAVFCADAICKTMAQFEANAGRDWRSLSENSRATIMLLKLGLEVYLGNNKCVDAYKEQARSLLGMVSIGSPDELFNATGNPSKKPRLLILIDNLICDLENLLLVR